MRHRLMILASVLMLSLSAWADDITFLVVENNNSTTDKTLLADFASIKFVDGSMVLQKDGATLKVYNMADLHKMYFEGESDSIDELLASGDTDMDVYTLTGALVAQGARQLSSLPKGIYIVRQGDKTRKILVR